MQAWTGHPLGVNELENAQGCLDFVQMEVLKITYWTLNGWRRLLGLVYWTISMPTFGLHYFKLDIVWSRTSTIENHYWNLLFLLSTILSLYKIIGSMVCNLAMIVMMFVLESQFCSHEYVDEVGSVLDIRWKRGCKLVVKTSPQTAKCSPLGHCSKTR